MSDRKEIAARQAQLLKALLRKTDLPEGFDRLGVTLTGEILLKKRTKSVRKAWPETTKALEDQFEKLFQQYAATRGIPPHGGGLLDGRLFIKFLQSIDRMPEAAESEVRSFHRSFSIKALRLSGRP